MEAIFKQIQYSFSFGISPFAEETHNKVLQWIKRFGLLPTEKSVQRYSEEKYVWWAARTFPFADKTGLYLVGCWTALFFIADDMIADPENNNKRTVLTSIKDHVINILMHDKAMPMGANNGFGACFSDLWRQIKQHSDDDWQHWFAQEMLKMLRSWQLEVELTQTKTELGLEKYIEMRPYFAGGHVCCCLLSLATKYNLPFYIYQHPILQQMHLMAVRVASWANDIHSLGKELHMEAAENMVTILAKEKKLSLQEAIKETLQIHDGDLMRLQELERTLPSFGEEMNRELTRYIQSTKALISGNHEWVLYDTNRYKDTKRVMENIDLND